MEEINNVISFFQNITSKQIVDTLIAIIIIILFCLFSSIIAYFIIKLFKWKSKKNQIKENVFYKPIKFIIIWIGVYIAIMVLALPQAIMTIINKFFRIGIIFIFAKGITNFFLPDSKLFRKLSKTDRLSGNKNLINFISKIVQVIIYIIAAFLIISELGYDLGGLVAGLGFGGVIIALAAQDIAKNLFGGVAIILDKPFVVGDWIETKNYQGSVEDISFRSTRIRTAEDTVITIQNSTLSNEPVINYARMSSRRFSTKLTLALETNTNVIEDIINKLKFALSNTEDILQDSLNITLSSISDDGIDINLFLNTSIVPYIDYLQFAEKINLLILKVLESENVKLAYPTKNINLVGENAEEATETKQKKK